MAGLSIKLGLLATLEVLPAQQSPLRKLFFAGKSLLGVR
jgi:hypothetical protein